MRELRSRDDRELHRIETAIAVIEGGPCDGSRASLLQALKTERGELLKIGCRCRTPTRSAHLAFVNRLAS
ncbi:MAG TPA: hypothetical protein VLV50_00260 [Stellaceae bacterium]|nr:hypothetical protein [Stellaceae bacterium]